MPIFQLVDTPVFPPPHLADESGLLAVGGDLSTERLLLAYEAGVFPWYNHDQPILWWSPAQRMMLYPGQMKVSKSLRQAIRNKGFVIKIDQQFEDVMLACSNVERKGERETWIDEPMIKAYTKLHEEGYAHSFEVELDGELVGGLYGVSLGMAFFGESMFSKVSNASKVALYYLHEWVVQHDFHFIDCQLHTDHLASLGAYEISRDQYQEELKKALAFPDLNLRWNT